MKTPLLFRIAAFHATLALVSSGSICRGLGEGIPEPSLVLYGVVRQALTDARITVGSIKWTLRPANGSDPVVVFGQLTNVNDQFSYVLFVRMESPLPGQPATPNTLALSSTPVAYDRSEVTVNGEKASLITPALGNFVLTRNDRGKVERIDLSLASVPIDSDGNGLPDNWERAFFSQIGVDPEADPDHDGLTNAEEWKAGTDPKDAQSQFTFISIKPHTAGGILIQWSSSQIKNYSVLRSTKVTDAFLPIVTGVAATPPINSYHDATAGSGGPYFYLLKLEE